MKCVAIIPARGGSKRIPRKNIKEFCGKPIISWVIEIAKSSGLFEEVIVSTDDTEIQNIANMCGATAPFLRPKSISDDFTGVVPVMAHTLSWFKIHRRRTFDYACLIYPTAPLILAQDLRKGLELISSDSQLDYCVPVTRFPYSIQRALQIDNHGFISMLSPENYVRRSQDFPEAFHDAGQFCWGRVSSWEALTPIFHARTIPLILPRYRVQDIDSVEDWTCAEIIFKNFPLSWSA